MNRPKVIFLDAAGTLFGVKGSVGDVYRELALQFGVDASAEVLNRAFFKSFKAAEPPVFPEAKPEELPTYEFKWWEAIAHATFQEAGIFYDFSDFAAFFKALYAHFATEQPWFVYSDVKPALERWRELGIELAVLSNFDSRLYAVLKALDLMDFFTSVTISSEAGAAKPSPKIFEAALEKHQCNPEQAWHIGDSLNEDYYGAKALGLQTVLLKRSKPLIVDS